MKTLLLLAALSAPTALLAQVRIQTSPGAFAYVTGDPDRPMIGVSTRSTGKRDTLGLMVESVMRGGPAEQAGIEEGDRLVAVNSVNLRLSPMDAGESDMDGVATRRLIREQNVSLVRQTSPPGHRQPARSGLRCGIDRHGQRR